MHLSIFDKTKILKYSLVSLVIIIMYMFFFYDPTAFVFISDFLEIFFGFTVMAICIHTRSVSKNKVFTYVGITLGFSALLEAVSVLLNFNNYDALSSDYVYLQIFGDYLKIFSLLFLCKFYNKNTNFNFITLLHFCITLSFGLLLLVFKIFPPIDFILFGNINMIIISNTISFLISLYLTYVVFKNINKFSHYDKKLLTYSSIFFNINTFLFIFYTSPYTILMPSAHITLLTSLFFIFKMVIQGALVNPCDMLFYELDTKAQELEKAKDLYEYLVEVLPVSMVITKNKSVVFANDASLNLFDCSKSHYLISKNIDDLILNKNSTEAKIKTFNDSLVDVEISNMNIDFNNSLCDLNFIEDISIRKRFSDLNMEIQKKLKEDKARTEFFSTLSHELRTPIHVMYSTLQLEDIYIKTKNMEGIKKYNSILKQNCLRLLRLCNNLIDVTRIDSGCFKPHIQNINIVSVIENIVLSVSSYVRINNMNITFDTELEESYIYCDPDLIERIILNLISNSLKYGYKGGEIWVNIYENIDSIKVVFKDNGCGIPKDKCETIFEKFIQVDKSFTRKCEGSGIGLSLVKSIVEILGGNISLESDEDKGCIFEIMLPKSLDIADNNLSKSNSSIDNIVEKVNIEFSDIYL